jgi:hypothetical protein
MPNKAHLWNLSLFHEIIKIVFSLNLHNFGYSVSLIIKFLHVGSCMYFIFYCCILLCL